MRGALLTLLILLIAQEFIADPVQSTENEENNKQEGQEMKTEDGEEDHDDGDDGEENKESEGEDVDDDNDDEDDDVEEKSDKQLSADDRTPYHEGEEHMTSNPTKNLDPGEAGSGDGSGSEFISDQELQSYLVNDDDKIPEAETFESESKPERVRIEGDIIINRKYDRDIWKLYNLPLEDGEDEANKTTTRAIVTGPFDKTWPRGVVPYYIHKSRMKEEKMIESAFKEYEEKTCLKFPRIQEKDIKKYKKKNHIRVIKGKWASSYLGRSPVKRSQNINLHNGFLRGNLLHEIMHAIGFLHEHSRTDRGEYVTMHPYLKKMWNYLRSDKRGLLSDHMGLPYDYGSITHYPAFRLKTIDRHAKIGQRIKLSENDICQINRLYKCHKKLEDLKIKCDCLDSYTDKTCHKYKKKGYCEKDQHRMSLICPNTCNLCCQSKCKVNFDKVGCFNDGLAKSKFINTKLKYVKQKRSEIPWVKLMSSSLKRDTILNPNIWGKWAKEDHLKGIICKCAKKAKKHKLKYFAVRFPGECWGGNTEYYKDGTSNTCFDKTFQKCVYSNVQCCTGMASGRFVYRLN
uniref:Metalloendopeptidase n=1 Tax=Ceriantheomorphe brasiliensis TaxID=1048506 RepID=A0A7G7WYR4_9CNID|nr:toxin candidate TRINITY_DN21719_c3_g1_i1 [Ceriantheomorphe brasiliensis]